MASPTPRPSTGLDPSDTPTSSAVGATVTADTSGSLTFVKTAAPSTGVVAGDVVTYTIDRDQRPAPSPCTTWPSPTPWPDSPRHVHPRRAGNARPGDDISCTATYTVTQADVNAGSIINTAAADGLDPSDGPVHAAAGATVDADQTASLGFTKTASPTSGVVAGDTVTYTFAGTNAGAVTLHAVTVTDPMPGLSALACTPGQPAALAPGDGISCSATYTVTQADVDAGNFSNTATLAGLDPSDNPVSSSASAAVDADQTATVSLIKSASPASGVAAGDIVTYAFDGTNTGTVTLHNVAVTDPMPGLSASPARRERRRRSRPAAPCTARLSTP